MPPPTASGSAVSGRTALVWWRGLLAAVVLSLPVPASAQAAAPAAMGDLLARVLAEVARQPLKAAPFIERRSSALTASPLESRGTLSYQPSGSFEKRTVTPIQERMTVGLDAITIQGTQGAAQTIRFEAQPAMAAYVHGLRAVLAGDAGPLRQHFDTQLTGNIDHWELRLRPRDAAVRRGIAQIVVRGERGQVQVVETTETGGDVNELTILLRAPAAARPAR